MNKNMIKISDDLTDMRVKLERIDVLTDEISAFFDTDINNQDGKIEAIYYFDSNRIKSDMIRDYITRLKSTLNQLSEYIDN